MNVWNLGWKLALVANGTAHAAVLDTYQAERQPVGRNVLPLTDRAFAIATSTGPAGPIRANPGRHATRPVRRPLPGRPGRRAAGFRTISQLAIGYSDSPAVLDGRPKWRPRGPQAGDRLPDAPLQSRWPSHDPAPGVRRAAFPSSSSLASPTNGTATMSIRLLPSTRA